MIIKSENALPVHKWSKPGDLHLVKWELHQLDLHDVCPIFAVMTF